jgi:hypothetical protein
LHYIQQVDHTPKTSLKTSNPVPKVLAGLNVDQLLLFVHYYFSSSLETSKEILSLETIISK